MFVLKIFRPVARFYYCTGGGRGAIQGGDGRQNVAGGEVSRAKKGCLRLHFEHFEKNGYFLTLKLIFLPDFTRTMSMSLLKITN